MLSEEETIIIQHLLMDDEGIKQFPYLDCCGKPWRQCTCEKKGKLTIGVGRNLDDVGISENEAIGLELNDIKKVTIQLEKAFPWFKTINTPRRVVMLSMAFNLGIQGIQGFPKMIKCIESSDFESAGNQMLNSKWASQVKSRAVRLAQIMKTGQF